jgi:hypothetical protein
MKEFLPALEALEEIEILFAPHFQLWVDRLFQAPAKLCEIKLLAEAEDTRVRVDKTTPKTRAPVTRENEMEIEDLSGHLGQYAGDTANSGEDSFQDFLLLLVRPALAKSFPASSVYSSPSPA